MANEVSLSFPDSNYTSTNKPSVNTLKSDLSLIENGHNDHVGDSTLHFLASTLYPVGSIYINAGVSTNPATLLGFGTWVAFGAGKMMVGIDSTDTDFDALTDTGGSKTSNALIAHTHTGPSHTHTGPSHTHTGTTGNDSPDHTHLTNYSGTGTDVYQTSTGNYGETITNQTPTTGASARHTHAFTTNASGTGNTGAGGTGNTGSAGSGSSFSIMNPYVTCYMWKRTV